MKLGDPVWFVQSCRGGYGYDRKIPATFLGVFGKTGRRVSIVLLLKDGTEKRVSVHQRNVRERRDEAQDATT